MIVEKVSGLLSRADACAKESVLLQNQWAEVEKEIFSILADTRLQPISAVLECNGTEVYFLFDWQKKQMHQCRKEDVVIDLKRVSEAGMIIANSGDEEIVNVN